MNIIPKAIITCFHTHDTEQYDMKYNDKYIIPWAWPTWMYSELSADAVRDVPAVP